MGTFADAELYDPDWTFTPSQRQGLAGHTQRFLTAGV
jgi:hypothetical protein